MAPALSIPGLTIGAELGRGVASVVYRGERAGRPVAIKVGGPLGQRVRGFRREVAALARVGTSGVPRVLEVGQADGRAYLVAELIEGRTLAERLRRGPLSVEACLTLAEEIASVLVSVHARGLVHRDLRPQNVALDPVRLLDFGFAAFGVVGTAAAAADPYSAPELLRQPGLVDARADLFALGRLLYHAATGRVPRGPMLTELAGRAALDARLRAIFTGLSEERPEDRYASAEELLADLRRAREGLHPRGPQGDAIPVSPPTPFVGRDEEQAQLVRAWTDAEHGWGGLHTVRGGRGSGKTRLMHEVHRAARRKTPEALLATHTATRATERPITAYRALLGQLVSHVERMEEPVRRVLVGTLRRELGDELDGFGASLCPALGRLLGTAPLSAGNVGADPFAEVAAELLVRVVKVLGPTLFTVDDAHWLDPVTHAVLTRLSHRSRDLKLLVLLFDREGAEARPSLPEGMRLTTLSEFSPTTVAELTLAHLGMRPPAALVEYTDRLCDGTPLGVLEVLDAMIESGALFPANGSFEFDASRAEQMHLPRGAEALLSRRLEALPAATRRVFEVAANLGTMFDAETTGAVLGLEAETLEFAFAEGRRAGIVGAVGPSRYQFLHDSVREALITAMPSPVRQGTRQAIAEALDERGDVSPYVLVEHYCAGDPDTAPARVVEIAQAATSEALAAFDNEAASRFFELGREAAERSGGSLPWRFYADAGEAELRLGATDTCVELFGVATEGCDVPLERARLYGRLSWAHQARGDSSAAWEALTRAFELLGHQLPVESPATAAATALSWTKSKLFRRRAEHDASTVELLCDLHYQNARLGFEYQKPARLFQSTLRARELASQLPEGESRAKTEAMYGVVMAMLGRGKVGDRHLAEATRMAHAAGSPPVRAYCIQLRALAFCFSGEFASALPLLESLIHEHGHWLEVNEYWSNVQNAYVVESLRGRHRRAWEWLQRAINRLARQGRKGTAFMQVSHATRATLAALWRELDPLDLERALRGEPDLRIGEGFYRIPTYSARAQYLAQQGRCGPELDALLREFEAEGIAAKRAHPLLAPFYVAVCQARVLGVLRASGAQRRPRLAALDRALGELAQIRPLPLFVAHLRITEAYRAFFDSDHEVARAKLAEAFLIADRENAPRVHFDAERCRAHIYRAEGLADAARARARAALHIARDEGAVHWEDWIHEELDVRLTRAVTHPSAPPPEAPPSSSRHQLRSLLRMLRSGSRQPVLEEEAEHLIDELVECVAADRGLIVFEPPPPDTPLIVARARNGGFWSEQERARSLLEQARKSGMVEVRAPRIVGADRVPEGVAVPLWLRDRAVGGVYLEREDPAAPFVDQDLDVVLALSHQVAIALELARALREHERLSSSLRHAQKMEAVGRFAGGMAHDFNNMLMVVVGSLDSLTEAGPHGPAIDPELEMIGEAVERAKGLTRQLLGFARRQPRAVSAHDINELLEQLSPMLARVLGRQIETRLELSPVSVPATIDREAFDQAIFNLAMNARHAMPHGGRLSVGTSRLDVPEHVASQHRDARPGPHAVVWVADTGTGMTPEVVSRAFDPFFTTRDHGEGTGLGLSTVYGFVHQSGGFVELESQIGAGTQLRLHFPMAAPAARALIRPPSIAEGAPIAATAAHEPDPTADVAPDSGKLILIVDDEPHVRRSLSRVLERAGYSPILAGDPEEALQLTDREPALLISDVSMPGMSGPELAACLHERWPDVPVLYISGYADIEGLDGVPFLQKPFSPADIRAAVDALLEGR